MMGFSLFTGKVGFLATDHSKEEMLGVIGSIFGNLVGCILFRMAIGLGMSKLVDTAYAICIAKLTQTVGESLIRAFFCGVLMYTAVWIYRSQ